MASLALIVSMMFIFVLIIGPLSYLFSVYFPSYFLTRILGLIAILTGIWWLLLPIPSIRYYGLLDIYLGYLALVRKQKK
jgi:hypothetical protein